MTEPKPKPEEAANAKPEEAPETRGPTADEIAAGEIVIPEYEQMVQRAAAANDVELLEDLHEDYHEARLSVVHGNKDRAKRRAAREREATA